MWTKILALLLLACGLLLSEAGIHAQPEFPQRPIRMVVPFVAGGGADFVSRSIGQKLEESLGQKIVVDYRAGGGGMIASDVVAHAAPDGYTLYMAGSTFTSAPSLHKKLPFNPYNDFAPISLVTVTPGVLVVHPSLPVRTVKELIALAKVKPGELTYGSAGIGAASHLAGEQFNLLAKIDILHVPFKGSSQVSVSLLGGEIFIAFINPVSILANIRAGRLRALAVTTTERSPLLPEIPTISEEGVPGYDNKIWTGVLAPGRTPEAILLRLNSELHKALRSSDVVKRLAADGAIPSPSSRKQFETFLKTEMEKTSQLLKRAGVVPR